MLWCSLIIVKSNIELLHDVQTNFSQLNGPFLFKNVSKESYFNFTGKTHNSNYVSSMLSCLAGGPMPKDKVQGNCGVSEQHKSYKGLYCYAISSLSE